MGSPLGVASLETPRDEARRKSSRCSRPKGSRRRCAGEDAEVDFAGLAAPQGQARTPRKEDSDPGDDVDRGRLPVQTCWPGDAGPFITLPAADQARSAQGQRNVGMFA